MTHSIAISSRSCPKRDSVAWKYAELAPTTIRSNHTQTQPRHTQTLGAPTHQAQTTNQGRPAPNKTNRDKPRPTETTWNNQRPLGTNRDNQIPTHARMGNQRQTPTNRDIHAHQGYWNIALYLFILVADCFHPVIAYLIICDICTLYNICMLCHFLVMNIYLARWWFLRALNILC